MKIIMKKNICFLIIALFAMALSFSGCGKPKLKNVRVQVYSLNTHSDTLIDFTGVKDGDTLRFNLGNARFNNGVMMRGDSVIVDYIDGDDDMERALVVTVLPKQSKVIDLDDPNNKKQPLKTADPKKVSNKYEY